MKKIFTLVAAALCSMSMMAKEYTCPLVVNLMGNDMPVGDIKVNVDKQNDDKYTMSLLNFDMNEEAFEKEKIRHSVQLCDTATHKVFYDKLEFIYVEIAKFNKSLEELETLYDKWLYALKNLYKLTQRPKELCDKVFDRLFEEAEIAKFTPQELREYEASKIAYRDIKNSVDTAKREGIAEGMEKKSHEIAKKMLTKGMDEATVMEITGLSAELIQQLKAEM